MNGRLAKLDVIQGEGRRNTWYIPTDNNAEAHQICAK
jgi:hypothetical protein